MIYLSGASDDLIEIEGDITEEYNMERMKFETAGGTVGRIKYGDTGLWEITIVQKGDDVVDFRKANEDESLHEGLPTYIRGYSDVLVLKEGSEFLKMLPD